MIFLRRLKNIFKIDASFLRAAKLVLILPASTGVLVSLSPNVSPFELHHSRVSDIHFHGNMSLLKKERIPSVDPITVTKSNSFRKKAAGEFEKSAGNSSLDSMNN